MTAVSKVILNGTTLMDVTSATATANKIIAPYTAMTADGVMTTGTASGGGGITEPEEKDVDFIDYDGTLLYSYSADEFLEMTELPPNPSHDGLVAQGWN